MERRSLIKSAFLGLVGLVVPVKVLANEELPILEWKSTTKYFSVYADEDERTEIEYAHLKKNSLYCTIYNDLDREKAFGQIRFNSGVDRPNVYVTISIDFDTVEQAKSEIPKIIQRNLWRIEKTV